MLLGYDIEFVNSMYVFHLLMKALVISSEGNSIINSASMILAVTKSVKR